MSSDKENYGNNNAESSGAGYVESVSNWFRRNSNTVYTVVGGAIMVGGAFFLYRRYAEGSSSDE